METSQAERYAGINVSYENSFTAIKKDIFKETVDKKKEAALVKEVIPIEEKPNKPKDKFIVKNSMNTSNLAGEGNGYGLNLTQEVKPTGLHAINNSTSATVEDMLNRTAA
jgi:hypothetical protein